MKSWSPALRSLKQQHDPPVGTGFAEKLDEATNVKTRKLSQKRR
jgi:hypothetical protein